MKLSSIFAFITSLLLFSGLNGQEAQDDSIIVHRPEMTVVGIECRTMNGTRSGSKDIAKLWQRFIWTGMSKKIPNRSTREVLALYCEYDGDYTQPYTILIGCEVSSVDKLPAGMVVKTIPASTYRKFSAVGEHPKTLLKTWTKIWEDPSLKRTYVADFEAYGRRFHSEPPEIDIYISVEDES